MTAFYMTPGGVGLNDGSSPANAFDWAGFDAWQAVAAAGDFLYVGPGSYTGTSSVEASTDGTPADRISIVGVSNLNTLAEAEFSSLPVFNLNAGLTIQLDNYWRVRNLKITGDVASRVLRADVRADLSNLDVLNSGAGIGITLGSSFGICTNSRSSSPLGTAMFCEAFGNFLNCIIFDSLIGLQFNQAGGLADGNLVFDCATALTTTTTSEMRVIRNTFRNGTIGLENTGAVSFGVFAYNIISGFTTPASWAAASDSDNWDYNVWHNSGAPVNVVKGVHARDDDPQFSDPTAGTAAGYRVQNAALRNFGATLITFGGIAPSVFDDGSTGIGGTTDPDLSGDQLLLPGLETITLNGSSVPNVYRMPDVVSEQEPAQGVYLSRNVGFHLPVGDAIYPGDSKPTVGMLIVDADDFAYFVLTVRQPKHSDYWGCMTREAVISGTLDLDDTVTLLAASYTKDPGLGKKVTHTADSTFTGVAAKIMLRPSVAEAYAGQDQILEQYDIYVAEDIGQVNEGDLLRDGDGKQYRIVSWRNRQSISELSVLECELRQVP